eukprot:Polyplicarium_translucidae@DN2221_c0_g1_i12.p5
MQYWKKAQAAAGQRQAIRVDGLAPEDNRHAWRWEDEEEVGSLRGDPRDALLWRRSGIELLSIALKDTIVVQLPAKETRNRKTSCSDCCETLSLIEVLEWGGGGGSS